VLIRVNPRAAALRASPFDTPSLPAERSDAGASIQQGVRKAGMPAKRSKNIPRAASQFKKDVGISATLSGEWLKEATRGQPVDSIEELRIC